MAINWYKHSRSTGHVRPSSVLGFSWEERASQDGGPAFLKLRDEWMGGQKLNKEIHMITYVYI